MPSDYEQFEVQFDNDNGTVTSIANAAVKVYKAADGSLLATLTADGNGIVAAGSLNVDAGTKVRFSWTGAESSAYAGVAGFKEELTT